jgi:hypothetical protein
VNQVSGGTRGSRDGPRLRGVHDESLIQIDIRRERILLVVRLVELIDVKPVEGVHILAHDAATLVEKLLILQPIIRIDERTRRALARQNTILKRKTVEEGLICLDLISIPVTTVICSCPRLDWIPYGVENTFEALTILLTDLNLNVGRSASSTTHVLESGGVRDAERQLT